MAVAEKSYSRKQNARPDPVGVQDNRGAIREPRTPRKLATEGVPVEGRSIFISGSKARGRPVPGLGIRIADG